MILYIFCISFQRSNVRNGRTKLNLLNETLSDSLSVYSFFYSLLIQSSGMEQFTKKKTNFLFCLTKKENFLLFSLVTQSKKKYEKWFEIIYLTLFISFISNVWLNSWSTTFPMIKSWNEKKAKFHWIVCMTRNKDICSMSAVFSEFST